MPALCDLPPELLQHILSRAKPEDIVNLRQCCSLLETLSRDRELWMQLLHNLCHDLRICSSYFRPWDLSAKELEAAACSHARFRSTLIRTGRQITKPGHFPLAKPSSVSTFFPSDASEENYYHWLELRLLPGGRLLCAVNHEAVQLFDLRGTKEAQLKLVASAPYTKEHADGFVTSHLDQSLRENDESTIFALCCDDYPVMPRPSVISVFEVASLRESELSLMHRGTYRGHASVVLAVHSGRPILYRYGDDSDMEDTCGLGLWDYESNRAVKWEIEDVREAHVDLIGEYVVCVTQEEIRVFSISVLWDSEVAWGETLSISNHSPLKTIELSGLVNLPKLPVPFNPASSFFDHQGPADPHIFGPSSTSLTMVFSPSVNKGPVHILDLNLSLEFSGASPEINLAFLRSYETNDLPSRYGCGYLRSESIPYPGNWQWTISVPPTSNREESSKADPLPARRYALDFDGGVSWDQTRAFDNVSGRAVRSAGKGLVVFDY